MAEFFEQVGRESMPKDQIELLQKQQKELKFVGRVRVRPGHTMFSYNTETGEVKVAPVRYEVSIDFKTRQPIRTKKILVESNCIYRQALNKKNFLKILIREGIHIKPQVQQLGISFGKKKKNK